MRMWLGKEQEGKNKGVLTLFVCAPFISAKTLQIIRHTAKKHGVEQIYLGAGKTDVWILDKTARETLSTYYLTLETSYHNYTRLVDEGDERIKAFDQIIIRLDVENVTGNTYPKLDDGKTVAVFAEPIKTDASSIKDGMYPNIDVELKI